jgi:mannose-6-phosphate isomerase-like protein (cupin superfamily)
MRLKRLPAEPDAIAPDGSAVRVLLSLAGGSMAVFELAAGETSAAVRHRTVEELWYFVGGRGEMWRRGADGREAVDAVEPGVSLDIPLGTAFQFRALGDAPLRAVGVTMPPWPGGDEAVVVPGRWQPTVRSAGA